MCEISGVATPTVEADFDQCGGTITLTYNAPTGCDNNSVEGTVVINVTPAPDPVITIPSIAGPLTCDEAANFVAPEATFTNGESGACAISGTIPGTIETNFSQCGGSITITWTVQPDGNCDRSAVTESTTIDVTPAPDPIIDLPEIAEITCAEAASFVAPDATFSNAEAGVCEISGIASPTVESAFDECGGTITLTYNAPTGCDNNSVEEVVVITVVPAPVPEVIIPELPSTMTCTEASSYVAPLATFSNGVDAPCLIEGQVPGEITENFTECGGEVICLLYTSPSPRDQRGSRMPSSA